MKLWFQIVIAVGIMSMSAASLLYAWRAWSALQLEKRGEEICKYFVEQNWPDLGDGEKWLTRRQCVNGVMGKDNWPTSQE
jgi:hypothetical protein